MTLGQLRCSVVERHRLRPFLEEGKAKGCATLFRADSFKNTVSFSSLSRLGMGLQPSLSPSCVVRIHLSVFYPSF